MGEGVAIFVESQTVIQVVAAIIILILGVWTVRGIYVIKPGYVGLLFKTGRFVLTLPSGFNFVFPGYVSGVRKVQVGSGPNRALGLVGTAQTDLSPDGPLGPVDLGDRVLLARSDSAIAAGTRVRVIQDSEPGNVLVATDRLPAGAKPPNVKGSGPLRPSP